jgi:hypothetical protein
MVNPGFQTFFVPCGAIMHALYHTKAATWRAAARKRIVFYANRSPVTESLQEASVHALMKAFRRRFVKGM